MDGFFALLTAGLSLTALGLVALAVARWRSRVWGLWLADGRGTALLAAGWTSVLLGTLCLCVFMAHGAGVLLWVALVIVLAMVVTQRRVDRRRALLRLLAAATRTQRPLAPAVVAFAQESQGKLGREALRLNIALESGAPLAHALSIVGPLTPLRSRGLLYLGQQTNQLTAALEEAADDQEPDNVAGEIMAHLAYFFWLLVFGGTILTFVMIKIVPAFRQIFEDFDAELPAITKLLISLSDMIAELWPLVVLSQLVFWGVFIYSLLIYVGWVQWRMPLPLGWMRGLETSAALKGLALAAEGGHPLHESVAIVATVCPDRWTRRQMERVSTDVASGLDWWESLRLRRLISAADRSLLQAAQRVGNVPWALREVAHRHRWRINYRLRWWLHVLGPPCCWRRASWWALSCVALVPAHCQTDRNAHLRFRV